MAIINVTTTADENNGTGSISLREAVIQANGSAGDDTIVLEANQTYTLTRQGFGEEASATGDLDILSGGGKLTILASTVSGATTTINGGGIDRVFHVNSGANLTLQNLTVKGGRPVRVFDDGSTSVGNGGGIYIDSEGGKLNLINAVITGNKAANGSGICNWSGTVNIANSTISFNTNDGSGSGIWNWSGSVNIANSNIRSNFSTSQGGGVHSYGTINITNSNIIANSATGGAGGVHNGGIMNIANSNIRSNSAGRAGGIQNEGTMNVANSIILSNSAGEAGEAGGVLNNRTMNINDSTIRSNSSVNNSGGIQNEGTMNIANSTISSNFAHFGGGIVNKGTMNVANSTISSNSASSSGGGIGNSGGTMNVANSTITGNTASMGSGLLIRSGYSSANPTVSVSNSIIAKNYQNKDIDIDTLTSATSEGYNLIGNATGVTQVFNKTGDIIGTATNPLNAKLGPLQNNGGLTKTHALLADSPAINKGMTTLTKDQRGYNRNGVADMGAYEYWETAYPTTGADRIIGTAGADIIDGLAGNDTISGLGGNDRLIGSAGDDSINGGAGDDTMIGGPGNDTYIVNSVRDRVVEALNAGTDRIFSTVTYTLPTNVENLTLQGTTAINGTGNGLANRIIGNSAANRINGGGGNDILNGGGGNDILTGGAGNDNLTGGTGADRFLYNTNATFTRASVGVDTITDFVISQNDKIVLDKTTFPRITSANGTGFSINAEFAKVSTDTAAAISGADIVYNTATGALFYNQNGTATGFGTGGKFAVLSNKPGLTENQFIIQA